MKRIPTLDGWRGLAILIVLAEHLQIGLTGHHIALWTQFGQHGVGIFFVLSGFLITSRLLQEDRIHLPGFYLRRFFRLMPCAWMYLLVIVLLGAVRHHNIGNDVWACIFFFRNYVPTSYASLMTGHFWSLSVEEQFYLAWPLLLAFAGRTKSLAVALLGIAACTIFRFHNWEQYDYGNFFLRSEVRFDALLVGCTLALLFQYKAIQPWVKEHALVLFLAALPVFAWDFYHFHRLIPLSESVAVAIMVASTCSAPGIFVSRFLELKYLKFIGLISYSLYVWQQLFLIPQRGSMALVAAAFLPLVAYASYAVVERPGVRLGGQIERRLGLRKFSPPAHSQQVADAS